VRSLWIYTSDWLNIFRLHLNILQIPWWRLAIGALTHFTSQLRHHSKQKAFHPPLYPYFSIRKQNFWYLPSAPICKVCQIWDQIGLFRSIIALQHENIFKSCWIFCTRSNIRQFCSNIIRKLDEGWRLVHLLHDVTMTLHNEQKIFHSGSY
jgi:hypothetical protein